VVTSNAEVLLDGVPRLTRHTYKEGDLVGVQSFNASTKRMGSTNGFGLQVLMR
jgi:hypothetical protein